jgi:hypothetical protein
MEPEPADSKKRPRRRWQFSLATLFIFMTVVCLILSRFYPRMYASAKVQVPAMTKATTPTYVRVFRTHTILAGVLVRHPEFTEIAGAETESWIRARMDVKHVEKDILELRMSGPPADRERLQELVDAIAQQYVDFLQELNGPSDEEIAKVQEIYDELEAQKAQTSPPLESAEADSLETQRDKRLELVASEIKRLKQMQKQTPPPPKVLGRSSGWDW